MRLAGFLLFALIISQVCAFTDYSFSLKTIFDADGGSHVVQKTVLFLDSDSDRSTFDFYFNRAQFTLLEWQKFSKTLKFYYNGTTSNLTIIAAREPNLGYNAVSVSLEYDVLGLLSREQEGPRSTLYHFDSLRSVLTNENGDLSLGSGVEFTLVLPDGSRLVKAIPEPTVKEGSLLRWKGPLKGTFALSFEYEKPLSQEINEFFQELQRDVGNFYVLALLLAFVAFIGFKFINSRRD
ncbi:MAG: hypothetical protein ABH803_02190 [Candidatus Micrarchaeota archaeon]